MLHSPVSSRTRTRLAELLRIARDHDWANELFADFSPVIQEHVGLDDTLAKYAHEQGCPWDLRRTCKQAPLAVAFKPKEACELLDEHGPETCRNSDDIGLGYYAACEGDLLLLQFAMRRGCNTEQVCSAAAEHGHLEILKWARAHGCPWDAWTCSWAAGGGHLECLEYAHEQGCPWDAETCRKTAYEGELECLKYAHEQGCPWDPETCRNAAGGGHLECLEYAHEQGCPWDAETCRKTAYEGELECLKYAHEQGCPWDSNVIQEATEHGHHDILAYAHEHGCPEP
eukprot:Transcript_6783.p1 GENE.Transcript_6783~~Transcript_6783.p1  ORF type:complete len:285 (-),score=65.05 Transcript_6783:199-1053(-)